MKNDLLDMTYIGDGEDEENQLLIFIVWHQKTILIIYKSSFLCIWPPFSTINCNNPNFNKKSLHSWILYSEFLTESTDL